jgi:hypothetical protein
MVLGPQTANKVARESRIRFIADTPGQQRNIEIVAVFLLDSISRAFRLRKGDVWCGRARLSENLSGGVAGDIASAVSSDLFLLVASAAGMVSYILSF